MNLALRAKVARAAFWTFRARLGIWMPIIQCLRILVETNVKFFQERNRNRFEKLKKAADTFCERSNALTMEIQAAGRLKDDGKRVMLAAI